MNTRSAIVHRAAVALSILLIMSACDRSKASADTPNDTSAAGTGSAAANDAAADATPRDASAGSGGDAALLYRNLRDMVIGCDNVRRCTVISAAEAVDATPTLQLSLQRDAGAKGGQQLIITSSDSPFTADALRIDGKVMPGIRARPWVQVNQRTLRLDRIDAIAQMIGSLRDGDVLGIDGDLHDGVTSLSGFAAALLLVDDQQQRLGTQGAWLRRGTRADAEVPAAPTLPVPPSAPAAGAVLSATDVTRIVASVRRTHASALRAEDCNEERAAGDDAGVDITRQDTAEPLDATHAVVFITCLSGAYQASSLVFIAPRNGNGAAVRAVLPRLPLADDDAGTSDRRDTQFAMLTNVNYDPATGTLSHFAKGRGIADCGETAAWRYDGAAFRLLSFSQMTRCRGGDPGNWPTLWRTAASDG